MTVDYRFSDRRTPPQRSSDSPATTRGVTIVHIAMREEWSNCETIEYGKHYGKTADDSSHSRYLFQLVAALAKQPGVARQIIITRAFRSNEFGTQYKPATEQLTEDIELWRCYGDSNRQVRIQKLWAELPTLASNIERRLCRSSIWPDIVHAHYADAAWIAAHLRMRFGIPFIYSAYSHSLVNGKQNAAASGDDKTAEAHNPAPSRQQSIEQYAASQADLIIASSDDEATNQYGHYSGQQTAKCVVIAPGCDVKRFATPAAAACEAEVATRFSRFLAHPERPVLLALARPATIKNLTGLLHAYGKSPQLQQRANLVICAGSRDDICNLEKEAASVVRDLIYLLDYYNLYGCVALPKMHSNDHVPAIYQWAARRRGIFVNVALYESFGLTLLEAAASGLPVIATDNGGPREILAHCQHGLLVDPSDHTAIASAALSLFQNATLYAELRQKGLHNVRDYHWPQHAAEYVKPCTAPVRPKVRHRAGAVFPATKLQVLATDLDLITLGGTASARDFARWLATASDWLWVVATGRNPEVSLRLLRQAGMPLPDYLIAAAGTEIYSLQASGELCIDADWAKTLAPGWQRDKCAALLHKFPGITAQDAAQQRQFKLSYDIKGNSTLVARVQRLLQREMVYANVVVSHNSLLDVMPSQASKGLALRHIVDRLVSKSCCVISAGHAGDDLSLIASADAGVVAASHNGELNMLRAIQHVYWSPKAFAAGVLDGISHFTGVTAASAPNRKTAADVS